MIEDIEERSSRIDAIPRDTPCTNDEDDGCFAHVLEEGLKHTMFSEQNGVLGPL